MAFATATDAITSAASLCTADRFRYPATRLQHELGLDSAAVLALDQLACTTLFGAVRVARAMMASEGIERALCVASEREKVYSCSGNAKRTRAFLARGDRVLSLIATIGTPRAALSSTMFTTSVA